MIGIILLLFASQSFLAAQGRNLDVADLASLCEDRLASFLTFDQVGSLADQLRQQSDFECPQTTKDALSDLETLLKEVSEDVCSKSSSRLIVDFSSKHLAQEKLPKALESFTLTYAMRVSQLCKSNLLSELTGKVNDLLSKDFEALAAWTRRGGQIDLMFRKITGPGVFVLPSDVLAVMPDDGAQLSQLDVSSALAKDVQKIKEICTKRFRPVFESVAAPLGALVRAGFASVSTKDDPPVSEAQVEQITLWARVVFLCRSVEIMTSTKKANSGTLEEFAYEPEAKVSLLDVEQLPANELDVLEKSLSNFRTGFELFRQDMQREIWRSVRNYMNPAQANELGACMGEDELESNIEPSKGAPERKIGKGWGFWYRWGYWFMQGRGNYGSGCRCGYGCRCGCRCDYNYNYNHNHSPYYYGRNRFKNVMVGTALAAVLIIASSACNSDDS